MRLEESPFSSRLNLSEIFPSTVNVFVSFSPVLTKTLENDESDSWDWACVDAGEQGWHSGESTRLPPMSPGFDSRSRRHIWLEFVVGSRPCSEGFSLGTPVFLPPQKLTFPNSNSTWKQWMEEPPRGIH